MKVLLPVDASTCCQKTLSWAIDFLEKEIVQLYLIDVVQFLPQVATAEIPVCGHDLVAENSQRFLDRIKAYLGCEGFHVERADTRFGDPVEAICTYADVYGIDQILLGCEGNHPIRDFFLGNTGRNVFKKAKQPVLLVDVAQNDRIELSHKEKRRVVFY